MQEEDSGPGGEKNTAATQVPAKESSEEVRPRSRGEDSGSASSKGNQATLVINKIVLRLHCPGKPGSLRSVGQKTIPTRVHNRVDPAMTTLVPTIE